MSAIFRAKALSKLRSPEQLDEPLKVINRRVRLAWGTFAVVAVLGVVWGLFGRLPEAGRGQGIILTPNTVFPIQAQAAGQVGVWFVGPGEHVEKDELLGYLEQTELTRQIDRTQARLDELKRRNQVLGGLRDEFNTLEREAIERKREELAGRVEYLAGYIARTEALTDEVHNRNLELLEKQLSNAKRSYGAKAKLTEDLRERLESYERLRAENLTSEDTVTSKRREYDDSKMALRELTLQARELDLNRIEARESYLAARNQIATKRHRLTQLELELQELDNRIAQLNKTESEQTFTDKNEMNDLLRTVDRDEKRLGREREIRSPYAGRVLELTAPEGTVVSQGKRLAQIDTREVNAPLVALSYFQDKIGKQIKPGDFIRVSPATVQQKRYGSIAGKVISVSSFAVTQEAVVNYVGNSSVAQDLTKGGYQIEVIAELMVDSSTPTGFAWTSRKGPDAVITAGTTADAWVTYERRPPVSYILPKVREWTGL